MKRLSIIIPGHKTPDQWWRRAVLSVLRACGAEDEVICIDDGSPVRPTILERLAKEDARVRAIYMPSNRGQSAARNEGLKLAQGQYVAFADSDDEVLPNIYAECVERMGSAKSDVCVFGVKTVWVAERLQKTDSLDDKYMGQASPKDVRMMIDRCLFEYVWNKLYRRKFLEDNKIIFDHSCCPGEDTIFNLKCLLSGALWMSVSTIGYVYYRIEGSSLSRYQPQAAQSLAYKGKLLSEYKDRTPDGHLILGDLWEMSARDQGVAEWRNAWRIGSPYGCVQRWQLLCSTGLHDRILTRMAYYVGMFFKMVIRRYLYVVPLRKINIRRTFPEVVTLK